MRGKELIVILQDASNVNLNVEICFNHGLVCYFFSNKIHFNNSIDWTMALL